MSAALRFGTDGWRAVIADHFTFANLERIAQATAQVWPCGPLVIGHDRRFLAAQHADRVAEVMAGNGFEVLRVEEPCPTPAISSLVVDAHAVGGIALTASHNPAEFGGFKLKSAAGGSVPESLTRRVEAAVDQSPVRRRDAPAARADGQWRPTDFRPGYFARLERRVDRQALLQAAPLTVIVDSMHGCGGRLIAEFLSGTPHRVLTQRADRDVSFGGAGPEPIPERLAGLREAVLAHGADLGLATDGDADRVAAVADDGSFLTPVQVTPLLAHDALAGRGERGTIAGTFANSLLLERIAVAHGVPFRQFPIGFKHLVPLLESGELLVGGEESGGIGVSRYLPERDGILIALLLIELRARRGQPLSVLQREVWNRYGEFHYRRRDLACDPTAAQAIVTRLATAPPAGVAGLTVQGVDTLDGTKLLLGEAGWVLVRGSGTEPVLRLYCEARSRAEVDRVLDAVRRLAGL